MGLLVIGAVHLNLYAGEGYSHIPTIGWLFLLTVITAFVLAAGSSLSSHALVGLSSAGFALSVLGGYLLTLFLPAGLFSFKEPGVSYSGVLSIVAEVVVAGAGILGAWVARGRPGTAPTTSRRFG
ncbi:MAG: hypothetical protein ACYDD4_03455 [Acidimicrobiales bacterium]